LKSEIVKQSLQKPNFISDINLFIPAICPVLMNIPYSGGHPLNPALKKIVLRVNGIRLGQALVGLPDQGEL